jgi:hypothetical protein
MTLEQSEAWTGSARGKTAFPLLTTRELGTHRAIASAQ